MRSTTSLPLLPDPLLPRIIRTDKILSMGQTEFFHIQIESKQMTDAKMNCLK